MNILNSFDTDQEQFWAGDFGDHYVDRNKSDQFLASNLNFFSDALKSTNSLENCIEFGANIGMNIKALKQLFPQLSFHAVEINKEASKLLGEVIPEEKSFQQSIVKLRFRRKVGFSNC